MEKIEKKNSSRAYLIWIICAVFVFYKYMLEVSPSVLMHDLMISFKATGPTLGILAASYYYAYTIMQIPVGLIIDRFGSRRTTALAIILCALGTMLFSLTESLFMANIGRFIMGLGAAFAFVNTLKVSAAWFSEKRFAFLAGLTMTVGMIGAVGGSGPLSLLMKSFGWRRSMFDLAIIGLIIAVIYYFIVRDRKAIETSTEKVHFLSACKHLFSSTQTWILCLYSGFCFAPIIFIEGLWGVPFIMKAHDVSKPLAAAAASFVFIGFAVGAPIYGMISTKIGKRKKPMTFGTALSLLFLLIILYVPGLRLSLLIPIIFLFGFNLSCFMLSFSVIHEIHLSMIVATAVGLMNTFNSIFGAINDPLIGKILQFTSETAGQYSLLSYHKALTIVPIYLTCALILLVFIKETYCQQKHR